MFTHHFVKRGLAVITVSVLAACSSIAPTQSTLGSSAELRTGSDGSRHFLKAPVKIQTEIHIAEVGVMLAPDAKESLSADERQELTDELRRQLVTSLKETYKVVETPSGNSHSLRATITDVRTSSVAGNVVSTVLLLLPVDKGGAAVEFELKSPSGERVAAMSVAAQGKFVQFSGAFSKLGQAKLVMTDHAKSLAELLQGNVPAGAKASS
ncbi:MAG: DUF3313 family protein [Burkholderiales bacterium]